MKKKQIIFSNGLSGCRIQAQIPPAATVHFPSKQTTQGSTAGDRFAFLHPYSLQDQQVVII